MLMWSVGNMSTPPPKAWVAKLLVATQVRPCCCSTGFDCLWESLKMLLYI